MSAAHVVKLREVRQALATPTGPYTTSPAREIVMPSQYTPAFRARFWVKVDKAGPAPEHRPVLGPCWLWTAAKNPKGYGYFGVNGSNRRAHRVAWEMEVGPISDGLTLDHLCRTPACVRPSHLEPVTVRVNTLRGVGPAALNAQKAECARGHSNWAPRYGKPGQRLCLSCKKEDAGKYNRRMRQG